MDDELLRRAETPLRHVPEDYRKVEAVDVAGQERGHSFHRGMHIAWAWGEYGRGRPYLDFLSEDHLLAPTALFSTSRNAAMSAVAA